MTYNSNTLVLNSVLIMSSFGKQSESEKKMKEKPSWNKSSQTQAKLTEQQMKKSNPSPKQQRYFFFTSSSFELFE